jgi:hypothetical protein
VPLASQNTERTAMPSISTYVRRFVISIDMGIQKQFSWIVFDMEYCRDVYVAYCVHDSP